MSNFQIAVQMCQIKNWQMKWCQSNFVMVIFSLQKSPKQWHFIWLLQKIQNYFDFTILMIKRYTEIQFNG